MKEINHIKAGLYICGVTPDCTNCPYKDEDECRETLMIDAYEAIKMMERMLFSPK